MKEFFVNLYNKFMDLSWVQWTIDYCKSEPIMAGIIGGSAFAVLLLLIVIGCVSSKRKKKRKAAAKAAQAAQTQAQPSEEVAPAPVVEEKKEAPIPPSAEEPKKAEIVAEPIEAVDAELVEEVAPAAELVEEVAPAAAPVQPVETPTETLQENPEEVVAPVEKATETPVEEKAPDKKQTKAKDVEEVLAAVERAEEKLPEQLASNYDENETDSIARYKGKWVICRVLTDAEDSEEMFFFELHASNGEKLLSSEEYTTYQGALRGIQTHKTNILKCNIKVTLSKKGDYIFKLLSGKNMLLCMGENYPTKARCESAIESTIRFAGTAVIDENVQDIVIKVPKEDDSPLPTLPENCAGKWIISSRTSAEGEPLYYFELFANNGEKLLSSEDYTTYTGAVNGIETHRKNIQQNNFRISLTKRGDYIYKLLNGNGQLLCLGEHYKTKRLCQNAVESVQRFALNSPILTDKK